MKRSALLRFLRYVRPHGWLIIGAALTGILKFNLPLVFPLVLKYISDIVVARDPHAASEATNLWVAAWCDGLLRLCPWLGDGMRGHLAAIGLSILGLSFVLAVVTFYRSYW